MRQRLYKCFSNTSNLKIHTRMHSGEKPYTCDYCPKRFNNIYHMKSHVRFHTGENHTNLSIVKRLLDILVIFWEHDFIPEKDFTNVKYANKLLWLQAIWSVIFALILARSLLNVTFVGKGFLTQANSNDILKHIEQRKKLTKSSILPES